MEKGLADFVCVKQLAAQSEHDFLGKAAIIGALEALLDGRQEAFDAFAALTASHGDPEALFMYGACQARIGDAEGAIATLGRSVDGGFTVPQALRDHPWLAPLRGDRRVQALLERADDARREAGRAFLDAGGPALLGS